MPDGATSDDPRVQRQLDRLHWLSPSGDRLGLDRTRALLDRLGRPQDRLPPVLHVAGTNGKGSTCAVLRAAVEAAGGSAHVFTSPHLVRFNERIRVAGRLIDDSVLARHLEAVLDVGGDLQPSFFEVATVVALLAFAEVPATAAIVEVGLGGRLDSTNVLDRPAGTAIATLALDHQAFLGDTLAAIAGEKAGIAKPGVPLVTLAHPAGAAEVVARAADVAGAPLFVEGRDWRVARDGDGLSYEDAAGSLDLAAPALPGTHQIANAGLAVALLRHQHALALPTDALARAPAEARWPARLQRLDQGRLVERLPEGATLWVDGGHNPSAGAEIAAHFAARGRPLRMVVGMLANKDAAGFLAPFAALAPTLTAVPIPGHDHHAPGALAAVARGLGLSGDTAADVASALARAEPGEDALVCGSLHLSGLALRANGTLPD